MASRTRDAAATPPGKEKKGPSPSRPTGPLTRRSPNPSATNSPRTHNPSTTTPSEKSVPNYLKATVSSRLESSGSKQDGKKPALASTTTGHHTSSAAQNPTLMRRRSFDKPPPRTQSLVSPNTTVRSASFSGKTVSSPKGIPEKNLRGTKDNAVKQHSLYARPVSTTAKKTRAVYVRKQDIATSSSTPKEQVIISPTTEKVDDPPTHVDPEPEMQPEIQEHSASEAEEEKVQVEDNDEKEEKDLVTEEQPVKIEEPVKVVITEPHRDEDVKIEPSTVSEEQDTFIVDKTEEEPEDKPHDVKEMNIEKEELIENNENTTDHQSVADTAHEEVHENAKEDGEEENKKEEAGSGSEAPEAIKETEQVQELIAVVEEKNKEEQIVSPLKPKVQVVAHGKKDVALSNDVIEETASKLREQRKNKVRALAGAFETVISLQEK